MRVHFQAKHESCDQFQIIFNFQTKFTYFCNSFYLVCPSYVKLYMLSLLLFFRVISWKFVHFKWIFLPDLLRVSSERYVKMHFVMFSFLFKTHFPWINRFLSLLFYFNFASWVVSNKFKWNQRNKKQTNMT